MQRFYCEAILFDLDGVLVNSNANVERHWRLWSQQHGLDAEKVLHISHGRPSMETIRLVAPHLPAYEESKQLHQRVALDFEGVEEVPGVKALVESLPEGHWAVVTSGDLLLAPGRLQHVGLSLPKVLITSDDVKKGKPDPEGYLKAAARLGFPPKNCLVIEDAIAGVKAARAAGMQVIGITTTYPAHELAEADARIDTMSQIQVNPQFTDGKCVGLEVLL
ncbi:phosphatase [filamentous cyanobacterium CCP1]|nr:phosphatase [filamentous cyanobacterium CCP2]PSB62267.1 phosphatase [filamentous cyanobacterium CCP1]